MPNSFCLPSQNGQPVSALKCHCTMSRTCASSFSRACFALLSIDAFIGLFEEEFVAAETQRAQRPSLRSLRLRGEIYSYFFSWIANSLSRLRMYIVPLAMTG